MSPGVDGSFPPFREPPKPQWKLDEEAAELEAQRLAARDPDPPPWSHIPSDRPGRFSGADATETERAAGAKKESRDKGRIKRGSVAHSVLDVFVEGERITSYEASRRASGDYHARRRECTRLVERGFLRKNGTLPNKAMGGSEHVDAYVLTQTGVQEQRRLGAFVRPVLA